MMEVLTVNFSLKVARVVLDVIDWELGELCSNEVNRTALFDIVECNSWLDDLSH